MLFVRVQGCCRSVIRVAVCLSVLAMVYCATREAFAAGRTRVSLNTGWRFLKDDIPLSQAGDRDTRMWQPVSLPHTWNTADPFDDEPGYRRAPAWYKRQLDVGAENAGRRLFLYFEGANQTASLYVNGYFVGEHVGGYTGFAFDITDKVAIGKPNLIALRVDNARDLDKPPIDGDFNIYGGIYRDLWLISTDRVHIDVMDMASSGIRVETPSVSPASATVKVRGRVVNSDSRGHNIEVVNDVRDRTGKLVASARSSLTVTARDEAAIDTTELSVVGPKLWSPDSPYLYSVHTTIREKGKVLDEAVSPLGFRWYRFDPNEGFFLNGRALKLRGTNRHQDRAGKASALSNPDHLADMRLIKQNGFNFVRLAHYPQDPAVLDAADRLGLMIWEEIPVVNEIHISNKFNENARNMLTEMVRQHRNHPSVIIWGFMNEVFLGRQKTPETIRATVDLARELQAICKREDPTRVTAIAFDRNTQYHGSGLDEVTDVVAWNLYHGWYYDSFDDFGRFLDDEHRRFPDRPLMVSEYGANGDRRVHSVSPKRFDSSVEWQRMYHESYLQQINARKYLAGAAVWNQFDFGSEFRGETIPHINQKGLYTYDRVPKDVSFLYRASYTKRPVIHIATRDQPVRSGPRKQIVTVYSNLADVELAQNALSLGKKPVVNNKAEWVVEFSDGPNTLVASADYGRILDIAHILYRDPKKQNVVALNCGSNVEYVADDGTIWLAETADVGIWKPVGNEAKALDTRVNILGTTDDQVFQTMREGAGGYRFAVPTGNYEVELRFAEPKYKEPGKRVFDVAIDGIVLIKALDLVSRAGLMRSFTAKMQVTAADGITIDLRSIADQPVISGILLRRKTAKRSSAR